MVNNGKKEKIIDEIESLIGNEISDDVSVKILVKKKFPKNIPDFVMLFQACNKVLAKELSPSSCKVFLYLIGCTAYSNHIGVNQQKIASDLNVTKTTVCTAIKQLKKFNIIIEYKEPNDRRCNVYVLNPHSSWKGSFKERFKAISTLDKNQLRLPFGDSVKSVKYITF